MAVKITDITEEEIRAQDGSATYSITDEGYYYRYKKDSPEYDRELTIFKGDPRYEELFVGIGVFKGHVVDVSDFYGDMSAARSKGNASALEYGGRWLARQIESAFETAGRNARDGKTSIGDADIVSLKVQDKRRNIIVAATNPSYTEGDWQWVKTGNNLRSEPLDPHSFSFVSLMKDLFVPESELRGSFDRILEKHMPSRFETVESYLKETRKLQAEPAIWRSGNYFAAVDSDGYHIGKDICVGKLTGPKDEALSYIYGENSIPFEENLEAYPVLRKTSGDRDAVLKKGCLLVESYDPILGHFKSPIRDADSDCPKSAEEQRLYDAVRTFRMQDDLSYKPGPRKTWKGLKTRRNTERNGFAR